MPLLFVLCLALLAAPAAVQGAELPASIPQKQSMDATDTRAVREFVTATLPGLTATDPIERQQARDALLAPLSGEGVSVAFRLEYSGALTPGLRRLVEQSRDEHVIFNACRIAGALATDAAVETLKAALKDSRASTRYAGAYGLRRVMRTSAAGRAPLGGDQEQQILQTLTAALRAEQDRGVFDGVVSAIEAVGGDERAKARAMSALCRAVSDRVRTLDANSLNAPDAWAASLSRALRSAQSTLIDQLRRGPAERDFAIALAEMSGHMLAHAVRRQAAAPTMRADERDALGELVRASEVTLLFADNSLRNQSRQDQPLAAAWPDPARTRAEAMKWIGPGGALTAAPYSIDASRFALGR